MLQSAYLRAKLGADASENEPIFCAKNREVGILAQGGEGFVAFGYWHSCKHITVLKGA